MASVVDCEQTYAVRAIAICAVVAGCGRPEARASARGPGAPPAPSAQRARTAPAVPAGSNAVGAAGAGPVAPAGPVTPPPGPRLPDGITPLSYDLTLELDPDLDTFTGHVAIAIDVAAPTRRLWLNAVGLQLGRVTVASHGRVEPVALVEGGAPAQMQGFALPWPAGGGDDRAVTLTIDYHGRVADLSGRTTKDEEGLFRERAGGRWYLYSQAESVFARKIVPCFDEPRWKPAWRVTEIVPREQVALANAPVLAERARPDGRREVQFAEIARLPSYLLAVAVGPFEIIDAGKLGRGHVPVRIVVGQGDGKRIASGFRELPRIIDELERYVDAPLPLAKLDLVAVPQFFGAMENPGLVTFDRSVLVGGRERVLVTAHELAHQWFGDAVTPAWWEHLWLSEGFASWLGERVTASLGGGLPAALAHSARAEVLEDDDQPSARPLVHPIASSEDVEPAFDSLIYEKAAAVIAMFEQFAGADAFRTAVRGYVAAHAGTSVTTQAFLDALAAATRPELAAALAANLGHAGVPVVELALRCTGGPAIVASVRDGVTIPVCVRFPVAGQAGDPTRAPAHTCFLAGAHTEQPLPAAAGCPAWIVGNEGGRGYYRTVWRGGAPIAWAPLSAEEWLARGDDAALGFGHGDQAIAGALSELTALAATRDPHGELAALTIAHAIDPLVADAARPAWAAWLVGRFADRMTNAALGAPSSLIDHLLCGQLVMLTRGALAPATLAELRTAIERRTARPETILRVDAARDPDALFQRFVAAAAAAAAAPQRAGLLESLGAFPAAYAPRVVGLVFDPRFSAGAIWRGLAAMLERGESRTAAWRAMHARIGPLLGALAAQTREVIAATGALCDPAARAEVAADFTPRIEALVDGKRAAARALERALASIDRCVARRNAAGDIAAALAATSAPTIGGSTPPR
jgi:peptidase M1-like protein